MDKKNKQFFIPYPVQGVADIRTLQARPSDVIDYSFGRKRCKVIMVENYDEQVYIDCKHEIERWLSHENRETRCLIPNGQGGYKRCKGNCFFCPRTRSGKLDSLDLETETTGFEPKDNSPINPLELADAKMSLELILPKIREKAPYQAEVFEDLIEGLSIPEIALRHNKGESTVQEHVQKAILTAKEILGN